LPTETGDFGGNRVVAELIGAGAGSGRIWLTLGLHSVIGMDPSSRQMISAQIHIPEANGIAVGEGAVWVSEYSVGMAKIDPQTGGVTPIPVPGPTSTGFIGLSGVGIGFGSVWVSDVLEGFVDRIDPATLKVIASIPIGKPSYPPVYASGIKRSGDSMWVTSPTSRTVVQIDPLRNRVTARVHVPYTPEELAVEPGGTGLWVSLSPPVPHRS
jgi:streptogramin lyase